MKHAATLSRYVDFAKEPNRQRTNSRLQPLPNRLWVKGDLAPFCHGKTSLAGYRYFLGNGAIAPALEIDESPSFSTHISVYSHFAKVFEIHNPAARCSDITIYG